MLPVQCRMARAALDMGVRQLAALADVSTNTVTRFEKSDVPQDEPTSAIKARTIAAIRAALEQAGVQFLDANDKASGPGVAIKG